MAITYKRNPSDSSWTTPAAGSIRIKQSAGDTSWTTITSLKEKKTASDTTWTDSNYVAYPNAPTSFRVTSAGNGDTKAVTFAWTAPAAGATVTGYRLKLYDSNNNLLATQPPDRPADTTTQSYTFTGAAGSVYYARIFTLGSAGESLTSGTTQLDVSKTKLSITIGAASYTTDTSGWGPSVAFTPGHWTQSRWPGEPYNDYTYHGSKAFDGDSNSYWTGQSWSYSGGSEWLGFYLGAGGVDRKIINLVNWPPVYYYDNNGNAVLRNNANAVTMDQWDGSNFNFIYRGWNGTYFLGGQIIPCDFVIPANATYAYRLYYTQLGYNVGGWENNNYRVMVATVAGAYQDWVTSSTTTAATANTIAAVA